MAGSKVIGSLIKVVIDFYQSEWQALISLDDSSFMLHVIHKQKDHWVGRLDELSGSLRDNSHPQSLVNLTTCHRSDRNDYTPVVICNPSERMINRM